MKNKKKILIIGAGPGGLSSGMILASKGFEVEIVERKSLVGGRNAPLKLGDFTFETGPTFVIMPHVFEEIFQLAGKKLSDYLDFRMLDVLYRLKFEDGRNFHVYFDKAKLEAEIARLFPGEEKSYQALGNTTDSTKFMYVRAYIDGTSGSYAGTSSIPYIASQGLPITYFKTVTLSGGIHTVALDFATSNTSAEARIMDASIHLWKLA
jgi:phytoene dehydrogenase-like protein